MAFKKAFIAAALQSLLASQAMAATCSDSSFNQTITTYAITVENTTVFDIANATGRGVCDIGRQNLMADVTIVPNVGQDILIPPQVCEPDNTSCIIPKTNRTRECINGGSRLYYTVNGDTYDKIGARLNLSNSVLFESDDDTDDTELAAGQFVKVPLCYPSQCVIQPYTISENMVYLDLAKEFGTTVGQIMMMSPTYNYSTSPLTGATRPTIVLPMNCTLTSDNTTILS